MATLTTPKVIKLMDDALEREIEKARAIIAAVTLAMTDPNEALFRARQDADWLDEQATRESERPA